jgi:Tol biopolymer transport system component
VVSSREQHAPSYAPDGTQIAFESNRSGSQEIVAFDSRPGGEANIYIVDKGGGTPEKPTVDVHDNCVPHMVARCNWIFFLNGNDSGHPAIWKVASN